MFKKIKSWVKSIIEKRVDKILSPHIQNVKDLLDIFEAASDVHIREGSLIIMIRKDRPQVKMWTVGTGRSLQPLIEQLDRLHNVSSTVIDTDGRTRRFLYEELVRRKPGRRVY